VPILQYDAFNRPLLPIFVPVFTVEERDAARAFVLDMASDDSRVTAGAVVGSFARGAADRWSDLDLTFAVADDVPLDDVIRDWTRQLEAVLDGLPLWDLQVRGRTYRVFLLPGCLQLDLSFTPASQFRPAGPAFALLFGDAGPTDAPTPPTPEHFFGLGVVQALHGRRSIERARYWQAEQAIGRIRECALSLACLQRGLDPSHGRGFDDLPADTLAPVAATLVASVEPDRLRIALESAVHLLLSQASDVRELASRIERDLRALSDAFSD
jgi:predicted nucleotidyltransferase